MWRRFESARGAWPAHAPLAGLWGTAERAGAAAGKKGAASDNLIALFSLVQSTNTTTITPDMTSEYVHVHANGCSHTQAEAEERPFPGPSETRPSL